MPTEQNPLVSVIVVAHERPDWLAECLRSIQAQTHGDLECIVVLDDDPRGELARSGEDAVDDDPRFRFHSLPRRHERSHCRNLGIEDSHGDWLAIVDGDDFLPPDSLALRLAAARAEPGHFTFGRVRLWSDGQPGDQLTYQDRYGFDDLRLGWPSHCTLLIDRERLGEVRYPERPDDGEREPAELAGEDVRFLNLLLKANPGTCLVNCRQNVYGYRRHASTSHRQRHRAYLGVIRAVIEFHGLPAAGDTRYRDSLTEKALYCLLHQAVSLHAEHRLQRLGEEADPTLLALAAWTTRDILDRGVERVVADFRQGAVTADPLDEDIRNVLLRVIADSRPRLWRLAVPDQAPPFDPDAPVPDFGRALRWHERHAGETCLLLCGPGAQAPTDSRVPGQPGVTTLALGAAGAAALAPGRFPDYALADSAGAPCPVPGTGTIRFLPGPGALTTSPQDPLTFHLPGRAAADGVPAFSRDITQAIACTDEPVLAGLQVAHYLGFSRVVLAGLDPMDDRPDAAWARRETGLALARRAFEADGRQVIDATPGSLSLAFDKAPMASALHDTAPEAAAPVQITLFPAFGPDDDIGFSLLRVAWYLDAVPGARVRVFAAGLPDVLDCRDCYDPDCARIYDEMRTRGRLVCEAPRADAALREVLRDSDAVICWKDGAYVADVFGEEVHRELLAGGTRVFTMGASERLESSMYVEVSHRLMPEPAQVIERHRERYTALQARLGGRRKAFLVATGPSSQSWNRFALEREDAVTIVCNSVINDDALMRALSPELVVFADPIFHFGCSTYARAFRRRLLEMAARHRFRIVIPFKYLALFCAHLPQLEHRVIAIPHDHRLDTNLDLARQFKLRATDNILTFLMLPLAASLAREIFVTGCDGRPLEQDDYFWSHNEKTQFGGEMAAIRRAHPSFFQIDYNDYYLGHCETLEHYAQALEARGQSLHSMWGSYIPALRNRLRLPAPTRTGRIIVSLNPDLRTEFGHWLHYDRRIAETTDDLLVAMGHRDLAVNPADVLALPVFSHAMRETRVDEDGSKSAVIRDEFAAALSRLLEGLPETTRVHCLAYTGDPSYIDALEPVFEALSGRATLSLNLFYAFLDFQVGRREFIHYAERYRRALDTTWLAARPWLRLFSDSGRMQRALEDSFGTRVGLWPVVNLDATPEAIGQIPERPPDDHRWIVFPGNGQLSKGFDLACDFIEAHGEALAASHRCRFVIRDMARDRPEINEDLERRVAALHERPWVDVRAGTLSTQEYLALFWHADVIVLPYRRRHFYARTSACAVNAILAGKPTLTPRDTWLSEQVQKFGTGDLFLDGDVDDLATALRRILDDPEPMAVEREAAFAHYDIRRLLPALVGDFPE